MAYRCLPVLSLIDGANNEKYPSTVYTNYSFRLSFSNWLNLHTTTVTITLLVRVGQSGILFSKQPRLNQRIALNGCPSCNLPFPPLPCPSLPTLPPHSSTRSRMNYSYTRLNSAMVGLVEVHQKYRSRLYTERSLHTIQTHQTTIPGLRCNAHKIIWFHLVIGFSNYFKLRHSVEIIPILDMLSISHYS